jgi:hypothetical protein
MFYSILLLFKSLQLIPTENLPERDTKLKIEYRRHRSTINATRHCKKDPSMAGYPNHIYYNRNLNLCMTDQLNSGHMKV